MDIKTYRAKTMRDALELVRRELGPAAAVLHTREVNGGPLGRLVFGRRYEVAASAAVNVPSRLPAMAGVCDPRLACVAGLREASYMRAGWPGDGLSGAVSR